MFDRQARCSEWIYLVSHGIPLPRFPPVSRHIIYLGKDEQPDDKKVDDHQNGVAAVIQRLVVSTIDVGSDHIA